MPGSENSTVESKTRRKEKIIFFRTLPDKINKPNLVEFLLPGMPEKKEKKVPASAKVLASEEDKSSSASLSDARKNKDFNINIEEMAQAGLHFGHKTSKIHPRMMPFLAGVRNAIHIIDLEKTKEKLEEALKFIQQLILDNKILLIVGTKVQVKSLVEVLARELALPYVTERWLGGTFTNFEIIKKRITYFKELERKKKEGDLEKYTKRERTKIDEELQDLEIKFGGIKNLEKLPDAILVLDMKKDDLAVKEAAMKGIKIIAISHTNTDPSLADYPIPANDDAMSSVKYILDKIKEAILSARLKVKDEKPQSKA